MKGILAQDVAEEDVKLWLVGTDQEAENAVRRIHAQYGSLIVAYLNRKLPGLPLPDKQAALNAAYEDVWRMGRAGNLDIDRPLLGLLLKVAHRKAVDILRGETRTKRTLPAEEYHREIAEAVHGSSVGSEWGFIERRDMVRSLIAEFAAYMANLRGRQRQIAHILADAFPEILGPTEVHEILMQHDPSPPSYAAVKRARGEVLSKFRETIERKYGEVWS